MLEGTKNILGMSLNGWKEIMERSFLFRGYDRSEEGVIYDIFKGMFVSISVGIIEGASKIMSCVLM